MRTLSLNFRTALYSQESGEVLIYLLTITHPVLTVPIRLTSDPTVRSSDAPLVYGTTSRGNLFLYVGMEIVLPEERDRTPPGCKMVVSNVDRAIIPLARSITSPPQVLIEAVLGSALDTVEFSVPQMDMVNLQYDVNTLTFDLAIDAFATEPYPSGSFNPIAFPALFV